MISEEKKKFYKSLLFPASFLVLMWGVKIFETLTSTSLYQLGIYPRNAEAIPGVLTSVFIHGDWDHLLSNSVPLFVSLLAVFYFYKNASSKIFFAIYLGTGVLVWAAGREVWHIGASGIVYGFIAFLFFSGIFRRDNRSIGLALIVTFLYGGMVWGLLPGFKGISWESHLFGALTGIVSSFIFRKSDPVKKYDWETEEEDDDIEIPIDDNIN